MACACFRFVGPGYLGRWIRVWIKCNCNRHGTIFYYWMNATQQPYLDERCCTRKARWILQNSFARHSLLRNDGFCECECVHYLIKVEFATISFTSINPVRMASCLALRVNPKKIRRMPKPSYIRLMYGWILFLNLWRRKTRILNQVLQPRHEPNPKHKADGTVNVRPGPATEQWRNKHRYRAYQQTARSTHASKSQPVDVPAYP